MKKILTLFALCLCSASVFASSATLHLDKAPDRSRDFPALQRGAKTFVTYCLNCHSASSMRYNRLLDIGFTAQQIKDDLLPADGKLGDLMTIPLRRADGKRWFGAAPPDLTVIARARASEFGSGSDWLYTYLRAFYRDEVSPTGWNNKVFENVGMPHVLWELQGDNPKAYDDRIADLVAYLAYMGEPVASFRQSLGVAVLIVLTLLFVLSYALKREYWKDIH